MDIHKLIEVLDSQQNINVADAYLKRCVLN